MKKIIILMLTAGIFTVYARGYDRFLLSTNEPSQVPTEKRIPDSSVIASKAKEFLEIQKKLFDIERDVIQQDQELKQIAEQIKQLQQQLREKVEDKLKTNEEYQFLKQRRDQIRQEYIKVNFKTKEPQPLRKFEKK